MKKNTNTTSRRSIQLNFILWLFSIVTISAWSANVCSADDVALFIDKNGKVIVQDLEVNGSIKAGEVKADKLTGDGSEISVGSADTLKQTLDKKFDKTGGTITGQMEVTKVLRAYTVLLSNPMRHRMYPASPVLYQDIFEAKNEGVIVKLGTPNYNETSWPTTKPWFDRPIIMFGRNNQDDGNGAKVTIPKGYDTVWVRVLGDRWNVINAYFLDENKEKLGLWTGGWRSSNSYSPDGSLADGHHVRHQWVPIPAGRAGELALISKPHTDHEFWISGLAFSKNPWAHAVQSAVGYHWGVNDGDPTAWGKNWRNWNGDSLSRINPKTQLKLKVPVVPSGRDKLLYLVEHNNNWNGAMHTGITVNGESIERFMATYDNPFARHWNSKIYHRYIAAHIPASKIKPGDRFLTVIIDMMKQDKGIHFREIGTHDMDIPWE